jgi:hypothetical protein
MEWKWNSGRVLDGFLDDDYGFGFGGSLEFG